MSCFMESGAVMGLRTAEFCFRSMNRSDFDDGNGFLHTLVLFAAHVYVYNDF